MELKGKPLSLGVKILAVIVAIGGLIFKGLVPSASSLSIDDILKVAGFIVLIFGTVDASMIIGNIRGARGGAAPPNESGSPPIGGGR